jgi:hypothetical protein
MGEGIRKQGSSHRSILRRVRHREEAEGDVGEGMVHRVAAKGDGDVGADAGVGGAVDGIEDVGARGVALERQAQRARQLRVQVLAEPEPGFELFEASVSSSA